MGLEDLLKENKKTIQSQPVSGGLGSLMDPVRKTTKVSGGLTSLMDPASKTTEIRGGLDSLMDSDKQVSKKPPTPVGTVDMGTVGQQPAKQKNFTQLIGESILAYMQPSGEDKEEKTAKDSGSRTQLSDYRQKPPERPRTFLGDLGVRTQVGAESFLFALGTSFMALIGRKDPDEASKERKEMNKRLGEKATPAVHFPKNIRGLESAMYGVAEMSPGMGISQGSGVAGGLATAGVFATAALVLGQLGPQAATPEEAISVPLAAGVGYGIGSKTMSFAVWYMQGAGDLFLDLHDAGVKDEIARPLAHIGGAAYGLVEFSQMGKITKLFSFGARKATQKAIKSVVKNAVFKVAKRLAAERAMSYGTEVLEEGLQGGILSISKDLGTNLQGTTNIPIIESALKAAYTGWQDMKAAAGPMALMIGAGGAKGALDIARSPAEIRNEAALAEREQAEAEELVKLKETQAEIEQVKPTEKEIKPRIEKPVPEQGKRLTTKESTLMARKLYHHIGSTTDGNEIKALAVEFFRKQGYSQDEAFHLAGNLTVAMETIRRVKQAGFPITGKFEGKTDLQVLEEVFAEHRSELAQEKKDKVQFSKKEAEALENLEAKKGHLYEQMRSQPGAEITPTGDVRLPVNEQTYAPGNEVEVLYGPATSKGAKVRKLVRAVSGQTKVGKLIKETIALRELFKAQQEAVKEGYKIGKLETQKKAEAKAEFLKQRMALRQEVASIIRGVRNLSKTSGVDPEYKKAIGELISWYDMSYRGDSKQRKVEGLRKYIAQQKEKGLDPKIPEDLVKLTEQKSINDMTVNELRAVYNEAKRLANQGKLKTKLYNAVNYRTVRTEQALFATHMARIEAQKKLRGKPLTIVGGAWNAIKDKVDSFITSGLRAETIILSDLDQGRLGLAYELLEKPVARAQRTTYGRSAQILTAIDTALKKLDSKRLSVSWRIDEKLALPMELIMHIYAARNDFTHLQKVLRNGLRDKVTNELYRVTPEQTEKAIAILTKEEKSFIDKVNTLVYDAGYPELNTVFKARFGVELPRIPGYLEIRTDEDSLDFSESIHKEMLYRGTTGDSQMSLSSFNPRAEEGKGAVVGNYLHNLTSYVNRTSRYIGFADVASHHEQFLVENRDLLEKTIGTNKYSNLREWAKGLVKGRAAEIDGWTAKLVLTAGRNAGVSLLAFNVLTYLRQPISFLLGASNLGMKNMPYVIGALKEFYTHPLKTTEEVMEKSTMLNNRSKRGWEVAIRELVETNDPAKMFTNKSSQEMFLFLIRVGDAQGAIPLWKAAYSIAKDQNLNEEQAVDYADGIIRRTQPWAFAEDLPPAAKGVLGRLFFQFQNQLNQNYNQVYQLVRLTQDERITKGEATLRFLVGHIIPALYIGAIMRARPPEEVSEAAWDILLANLVGMNFISNMVGSAIRYQGGFASLPPGLAPYGMLGTAGVAAAQGKWGKAAKYSIKAGLRLKGIPEAAAWRMGEGLWKLGIGESDNPLIPIWGEYTFDMYHKEPKSAFGKRKSKRSKPGKKFKL